tara:strand:+ start:2922 stop:4277 length:1356 start_codon:yes stop_codon:yes gene_type:complete
MTKVTVYIPCRNHSKFISQSIKSVLRQTYKNWELIIIDDHSSDESLKIIKTFKTNKKIRILKTSGIGLPKVCNLAIKKSTGDLIIRLDGDDIFNENILEIMVNYFKKEKNLAMIYPDYIKIDQWGNTLSYETRNNPNTIDKINDIPPNGACMMIRKKIILKRGGYREDLGAQDGLDLWSRLKDKFTVKNLSLPLFYYRQHKSNLTSNISLIEKARKRIKKDAAKKVLKNLKPIFCILPCRKYFDFKENLWKEKLGKKNLLENEIDRLIKFKTIDKIIVTCDDIKAKKIVKKYNSKKVKFFHRDYKDTFVTKSLKSVVNKIQNKYNKNFNGITIVKYFQAPFVKLSTIEEVINSLAFTHADSVISVEKVKDPIYKRGDKGLQPLNTIGELNSEYGQVYLEKNICIAFKNKNLSRGAMLGKKISSLVVNSEESFFIDTIESLKYAKKISKNIN